MNTLAYKPGLDVVLDRLRRLYARQAQDQLFAVCETPSQALADFAARHPEGFCPCPDPHERAAFWDRLLAERAAVEDDSVPSAYLSEMDQGLYGATLGGAIQFMAHPESGWISSMVPPLLSDWSQFDGLRFDRRHPWLDRYQRQLDIFAAAAAGKFGLSHFILIDGLNFAFELVGATKTYLSLDERPEMLRRAIDFAYELNVAIQEMFFAAAPPLADGTCSNMVQWLPGRIVSESVDPFHMTSVACFEAWGREPVERILARFDGGVLHIHGNGRHLLEAVRTIRGLKAIYLGDDRGLPPAFDVLAALQARTGDLPLVVTCRFEPFAERLARRDLPGGVLYRISGVPDVAAANRLMQRVRGYGA
jgi:hypothetical protein